MYRRFKKHLHQTYSIQCASVWFDSHLSAWICLAANFKVFSWQYLGPLLKVKLLLGYIYPLVVHVAQWLIGELVSDQHKLVWKSDEIKTCIGIAFNYKLGKQRSKTGKQSNIEKTIGNKTTNRSTHQLLAWSQWRSSHSVGEVTIAIYWVTCKNPLKSKGLRE